MVSTSARKAGDPWFDSRFSLIYCVVTLRKLNKIKWSQIICQMPRVIDVKSLVGLTGYTFGIWDVG